jgi:hypothetical protein
VDLGGGEERGAEGPLAVRAGALAVGASGVGVGAVPDAEAELRPVLAAGKEGGYVLEGPGGADVVDRGVGGVHQRFEGLDEVDDLLAADVRAGVLLVGGVVDDRAGGVVTGEVGFDGGGEDGRLAALSGAARDVELVGGA